MTHSTARTNGPKTPQRQRTRTLEWVMLALAIISFVGLNASAIGFCIQHGPDAKLFFTSWFANWPSSQLFGDIGVVLVAFWVWAIADHRRTRTPYWWLLFPVSILVGIGCGIPLYLWLRERQLRLDDGVAPSG
ncbi:MULTISPECIES: DUF2834 domain-containing protein [Mycobacteroides]|jgi:hypothetical protein|uniref:DUF2834 domain-containing protein n=1 Tax=Mycobacteroides TaxID=670516 RepID=UPI0007132F8F|nr:MULTISPECIES: DUF2834 domain-containing protein [Mycobacteroides]KRQ40796.1 hypothetical protein AOT92_14220 [Mycobacteroides sp. H101]